MTPSANDTLEIRPLAGASETEDCARMMADTDPWLTLGRNYEACLQTVGDQSKEVYVARLGGAVAGFLIINMAGPFAGYIQTVCVHPRRRGQGIGSRLIRWAEERIFRESPNVFMCVSSFNGGAAKLYRRLGYEVVGELKDYVVRGHSEFLLRKSAGPWAEFRQG
ncbi:MAG: GNAT family N-acetyltransferase [Acidobacteria bacterium]|nr:GNAT family N-acetyltransferase [Acidobacteriota bacterium]